MGAPIRARMRNGPARVYLLHWPDGSHYIGCTTWPAEMRLARHLRGRGSVYVYNRSKNLGPPIVGATIEYRTTIEALVMEKRFKWSSERLEDKCRGCLEDDHGEDQI